MTDISVERAIRHVIHHPLLQQIGALGEQEGLKSFVVGGWVRDVLLGKTPPEIDIMVVGDGIHFARKVRQHIQPHAPFSIYRNFGTARIELDSIIIEFVGARKESYRRESRNPKIQPGTLEEDLQRRDFTINAMAIGLSGPHRHQLIDLFNGLNDLRQGIIRTPLDPHQTFDDDPLRMLRAIRFATQLRFHIHPITHEAIQQHKERIQIVAPERIRDEFHKILMSPQPAHGLRLLDQVGLLNMILPELTALKGVTEIDRQRHKDNFYHTLQVVDNIAQSSNHLWLRWAALLHDIGKARTKRFTPQEGWTFHGHEVVGAKMIPRIFRRLALPLGEPMRYVQKLVRLHQRPVQLVTEPFTDSAIRRLVVESGDQLDDLFTLCKADITTRDPQRKHRYRQRLEKLRQLIDEVIERDRLRNWQPPITGDIIMKTFGIPPSRTVGEIKNAVREAILDGVIPNDYRAAFDYMIKFAKEQFNLEPTNHSFCNDR